MNIRNLILIVVAFLTLNASTMNGFLLKDESLIFFVAFLGIFIMPTLSCYFLYKEAIANQRRHFLKGFITLTIAYFLTNIHSIFSKMDGEGRGVFNLIMLLGFTVILLSSIVAEIFLIKRRRLTV